MWRKHPVQRPQRRGPLQPMSGGKTLRRGVGGGVVNVLSQSLVFFVPQWYYSQAVSTRGGRNNARIISNLLFFSGRPVPMWFRGMSFTNKAGIDQKQTIICDNEYHILKEPFFMTSLKLNYDFGPLLGLSNHSRLSYLWFPSFKLFNACQKSFPMPIFLKCYTQCLIFLTMTDGAQEMWWTSWLQGGRGRDKL